jgi:type II secretory pathway pseudopilin PulG
MKNRLLSLLIVGAAASMMLWSCGKSDEIKKLEAVAEAAKNAAQGAADAAKNAANGGGGSAGGATKVANAADFHKLQDYLPGSINGYETGKKEGTTMSTGEGSWSTAECKYTKGDAEISVTVFDYAANASLLQVYKMKFAFENEDGYTKTTTYGAYPGWETWEKNNGNATCAAIVGDRFVVIVTGEKQSDAATIRDVLGGMNLGALAGL